MANNKFVVFPRNPEGRTEVRRSVLSRVPIWAGPDRKLDIFNNGTNETKYCSQPRMLTMFCNANTLLEESRNYVGQLQTKMLLTYAYI